MLGQQTRGHAAQGRRSNPRDACGDENEGGPDCFVTNNPDTPRDSTLCDGRRPAEGASGPAPGRPPVVIAPRLSDAELVTLAMMQAMPGFTSEAKWFRHARAHPRHLFALPAPASWLQQAAAQGRPSHISRSMACRAAARSLRRNWRWVRRAP